MRSVPLPIAWLFKYILVEDRKAHETQGWTVVGPGPCIGGWESLIVIRQAEGKIA